MAYAYDGVAAVKVQIFLPLVVPDGAAATFDNIYVK